MTKRHKLSVFVLGSALVLLPAIVFLAVGKNVQSDTAQDAGSLPAKFKGVSISPVSFETGDYLEFFDKASEAGNAVTWAGDWLELESDSAAPYSLTKTARQKDLFLIPIVSAYRDSDGTSSEAIRPVAEYRERYIAAAKKFAEKNKPPYFGVGIEINRAPNGEFEVYADTINGTFAAIKKVSPETQVFTVFQLELLKGRYDGLFGGRQQAPSWELLDKFPSADLMVFTSYPGLIYKSPADIPNDYYTEIRQHTDKKIGFTELGWASASTVRGWESDGAEQAEFIENFKELTAELDTPLLIWSFLYDQEIKEPFTSMGLIGRDKQAKPGFAAWQSLE